METTNNSSSTANRGQIARWVETAGESGEPDGYAGKRHAVRFKEGMLLAVTLDPVKPGGTWNVYMHNVSDGGFAFWSKREVPARGTVYVRDGAEAGPRTWLKARVTHCTVGIRGFLIGAAFETFPPPR